ncbi:hypothetical protein ES707_18560 [subsurface metagenome]
MVIIASVARKRYPGRMNRLTQSRRGWMPSETPACAAASTSLTAVVPTQMTRRPSFLARVRLSAVLGLSVPYSRWMWCRVGSSSRTGMKVSSPMCRVTNRHSTPISAMCSISCGVKCSPAVGAAALPGSWEYTVW